MINVATWNINSIRIRLNQILYWMKLNSIDILSIQETKIRNEYFPEYILNKLGYYSVFHGQKSYNGVAIISKFPILDIITEHKQYIDPDQSRILAATSCGIRIINIYVPNGNNINSDKYFYKLIWLKNIILFIKQQLSIYPKIAIFGDFNIAPGNYDVYDITKFKDSVFTSIKIRKYFYKLLSMGFTDSFRNFYKKKKLFTWWDYRNNSFEKNKGLRIDHILLTDILLRSCNDVKIDIIPRTWNRPSDHVPVICILNNSLF